MRIYCQEKKFYVYQYVREHASKYGDVGSPYYIGKGSRYRAHERNHFVGLPPKLENIQIISHNMSEADAFQSEILLIYYHGRIDLGTGILRNKTNGGDGVSGRIVSMDERNRAKQTKIANGTLNCSTPEAVAKAHITKKRNGTLSNSEKVISKMLDTRRANNTMNTTSFASREKSSITRKKNGIKMSEKAKAKILETRLQKYGTLNLNTPVSIAKRKLAFAERRRLGIKQRTQEKKCCPHCTKKFGVSVIPRHIQKCLTGDSGIRIQKHNCPNCSKQIGATAFKRHLRKCLEGHKTPMAKKRCDHCNTLIGANAIKKHEKVCQLRLSAG